jgi:hypothetical protein
MVALSKYLSLFISLFEKCVLLWLKLIHLYCHRSIFRCPPWKIFTILGAVASTLGNYSGREAQDPRSMTCRLPCNSFPTFPWTKLKFRIVRCCQLWDLGCDPRLSCISSLFDHHLHLRHHPVLVAKFRSSSMVTILMFV